MDDIELMDDPPLYDPDPDMLEVECPHCEGTGDHWQTCWSPGEPEWVPCSACGGTGTVERSPDR